jgi:hypothetical protein
MRLRASRSARGVVIILVSLTLTLTAPAAAQAETFFVNKAGSGEACTEVAPCEAISTALVAARAAPGTGDEIQVGPGLYVERVVVDDEQDAGLTLRGASRGADVTKTPAGATTVRSPESNKGAVIAVSKGSGVSIEDLRVEVPSEFVNTAGIELAAPTATIRNAHVQSAGDSATEGVFLATTATNANVLGSRVRQLGVTPGLKIFGSGATVADSDVRATNVAVDTEFSGTEAHVLRSRLEGGSTVVTVRTAEVVIDSSLILGGSFGVEVFSNSGARQAILSNDTIDAGVPKVEDGGDSATRARAEGGAMASVALANSIAMERQEVEGSATASVTCTSSMVNLQAEAVAAGTVSCDAKGGNAFAPVSSLFVPGNDWHLPPGSPAVDSGLGGDSLSGTDLDGATRIADGNGDGIATIDRGAYELPVQPPQAAFTAPTATPSNAFKFRKLKRNKGSGTAKLQVEIPGPGRLVLFGKKVKKFIRDARGAGTFGLKVIPKHKLANELRSKGTVRMSVRVKFTPTGGIADTRSKALKLIHR